MKIGQLLLFRFTHIVSIFQLTVDKEAIQSRRGKIPLSAKTLLGSLGLLVRLPWGIRHLLGCGHRGPIVLAIARACLLIFRRRLVKRARVVLYARRMN
jgi:hypothetical protein